LFEIVKRLQANNTLDEEYFRIIASDKVRDTDKKRLGEILAQKAENGKIVAKLLEKLQPN
jgi:hypothetical protein